MLQCWSKTGWAHKGIESVILCHFVCSATYGLPGMVDEVVKVVDDVHDEHVDVYFVLLCFLIS